MARARVERRADGIAVLRLDTPDSPVNLIGRALLTELRGLLELLEADANVRGIVVASAKPDGFIAGADVGELAALGTPEAGATFSRDGQAVLARLAAGKPVVAAMHGPVLGAGLEVALACGWRVATDNPRTVLGLPEVQLGLLPGGGGTQRLPRLIGLRPALPLLLTGKRVGAREALELGLVDELCPAATLEDTAVRAALSLADGSAHRRRLPLKERLFLHEPLRGIALRAARNEVWRTTRGHYPAPPLVLRCVATGLRRGAQAGYAAESEGFGRLAASDEARNLIWIFQASSALKRPPEGVPARSVRSVAVVGAGFMGEGIAAVSLPQAEVVLRDVSTGALDRTAMSIREALDQRVRRGALAPAERDRQLARLRVAPDVAALASADLVIEAVNERLEVKRRVLAEVETVIAPDAVFASNTSALPISAIAAGARHPERVVGMHYFSPVPRMPLLEVVVPAGAAERAVATARLFGTRQGKSVIVVRDGPGFFTTRVLAAMLNEAMLILEEGAGIDTLDRAARNFGFPVGPCALLDEVGIDIGAHVSRDLARVLPRSDDAASDALGRLFDAGFLGRKNARGFYLYTPIQPGTRRLPRKQVNQEILSFFNRGRREGVAPPPEEMEDRLTYAFAGETVRCLEEKIVASARDADVGAVLGLGFPPFHGGPLHWLDTLGAEHAVWRFRTLVEHAGARFEPPDLLVRHAEKGTKFH